MSGFETNGDKVIRDLRRLYVASVELRRCRWEWSQRRLSRFWFLQLVKAWIERDQARRGLLGWIVELSKDHAPPSYRPGDAEEWSLQWTTVPERLDLEDRIRAEVIRTLARPGRAVMGGN